MQQIVINSLQRYLDESKQIPYAMISFHKHLEIQTFLCKLKKSFSTLPHNPPQEQFWL